MLTRPDMKAPFEPHLRDHDLALEGQKVLREVVPVLLREEVVLHDGDHVDEALRPDGAAKPYRRDVVRLVAVFLAHRPSTNFKMQPAVGYRDGEEEEEDPCHDPLPVDAEEEGEEKGERGEELRPEPLEHRLEKHAPQGHVLGVGHVREGIEVVDEVGGRHSGMIPLMSGGPPALISSNSALFSKAFALTGTRNVLLGFPCSIWISYRRVV